MSKLVIALVFVTTFGCSKGSGWAAKAMAMADDVCNTADKHAADEKMRKFIKEMTADKDNVGLDELDDIGAAEKRAQGCIDKAK
jgi:hypothetical protein